ncbi:MAG: 5-formyltetrahydrofolate cyclo-ligase [Burkholderiaceae bacterium]
MSLPEGLAPWRRAQRAALLEQRMAVPQTQHRIWNEMITGLLLEGFPLLRGKIIGIYWPYKGEFDPRFAIHRLRRDGARAALPVVLQKNAALQFREWWPGVATERGVYNLPVPIGTQVVQPEAALIPPIGFDARGYRLGYGGGFFDRTLAAMAPQPLKIGVAFELSRMASIQPQPHDIPMDFIVSEAGIYHVGPNGLALIDDKACVAAMALEIVEGRKSR